MAYDVLHTRRNAVLRVLCFVVLLELVGVTTGLAIAVQAGRSDVVPADAALVLLSGNDGDSVRLDRAQQAWSSGSVGRIVVGGPDVDAGGEELIRRGVQAGALVRIQASSDAVLIADTERALAEAGLRRVLVIAEPGRMLRALKIARDVGLEPHSVPVGTTSRVPVGDVVLEVGRYFRYILVGQ